MRGITDQSLGALVQAVETFAAANSLPVSVVTLEYEGKLRRDRIRLRQPGDVDIRIVIGEPEGGR